MPTSMVGKHFRVDVGLKSSFFRCLNYRSVRHFSENMRSNENIFIWDVPGDGEKKANQQQQQQQQQYTHTATIGIMIEVINHFTYHWSGFLSAIFAFTDIFAKSKTVIFTLTNTLTPFCRRRFALLLLLLSRSLLFARITLLFARRWFGTTIVCFFSLQSRFASRKWQM